MLRVFYGILKTTTRRIFPYWCSRDSIRPANKRSFLVGTRLKWSSPFRINRRKIKNFFISRSLLLVSWKLLFLTFLFSKSFFAIILNLEVNENKTNLNFKFLFKRFSRKEKKKWFLELIKHSESAGLATSYKTNKYLNMNGQTNQIAMWLLRLIVLRSAIKKFALAFW